MHRLLRLVLPGATVVRVRVGLVRTGCTWGWSIRRGSGHGGRSKEEERREVTSRMGETTLRLGHVLLKDKIRGINDLWQVYDEGMRDTGPVELLFMYYELMDPCVHDMIEHAEPLGSLGLNGAGDVPVEYIPTDEGVWTIQQGANRRPIRLELPAAKAIPAQQIAAHTPFINTLVPICFREDLTLQFFKSIGSGASSSSDSEEEVQCLMADDTEEVFDFSNPEFTREDLFTALNEMVLEYKKLSQSFKEFKAEEESCATSAGLAGSSAMQATLSKLENENADLRSWSEEMLHENQWLADTISSWTKSSASLQKLQGATKHSVIKPDWVTIAMKAVSQKPAAIQG
ncbi:hypothetical protein F511_37955 [Dorcoceras hygrometricum]|uniref:Uncharacterized protein n=1 Tax=Dorcoceras hygrometricum TaxID=472368 RepID=A0A2Z7B0N5_9LAMI|nr:hypothetical protein F511_37955 [Dorcoceras hygrometricum]